MLSRPTIDRQRGAVLAAYGEAAAAQIDAAAGGSSVARRVNGVLAHQHKVHVAGREVNGDFLIAFVGIFLCLLNRRVPKRQGAAVPHDVVVFGGCTICCDGAGGCVRCGVNNWVILCVRQCHAAHLDCAIRSRARRQRRGGQQPQAQKHCKKSFSHVHLSSFAGFFLFRSRYLMHNTVITTAAVKEITPTST